MTSTELVDQLEKPPMGSDSHTPGPWVYYEGSHSIWSRAGTAVCVLSGPRKSPGNRHANAALITAAPCMKEALEKSLRLLELVSIYDDADDDDTEAIEARAAWQRDLDSIRAVLTKASAPGGTNGK